MLKQTKKFEDKVVVEKKEKAFLSDSDEELARTIIGGIVNGTPRLDKVIEEALNGDTWYDSGKKQENASKSSKDFYENNWQQVPVKFQASTSSWRQPPLKYSNQWMEQPVASSSKPVASSSQPKKKPKKWVKLDLAAVEKANINLARQQYLSNQKDRYHYTHPGHLTAVKNFIELMENQLETKIKQFCSDRGGEFKSKDFDAMLKAKGIIRQTSAPHIHQQNGRAERINNTILEKSEALRTHSGCPQSWWEFSFETAIHVYNRTPIRRTKWTTPFENLFNKKPDVHYFKALGCLAWVYIPKELPKNKLYPKSEKMTFVGYDIGSKAYKFMRKDNAVFIAAHALFDENTYPRLKNENGFGKNKLVESPTGITKDQEEIIIPTNPTIKPINHDHNPDHNNSSDDTSDDEKQKSESEEEEESIKSESEVEKQLETSREHSRECSIHLSNEKSDDGSHSGYETDHGLEDEPKIPDEPEEPPQQL